MSTIMPTVPVLPNQVNQSGNENALILEQFTGDVEHTYVSSSVLEKFFPRKQVKGTNTLTKKAIGRTKLQKLKRGDAPDGTQVDFSKASVTVDTMLLSRHSIWQLDEIFTDIDTRKEIAIEQGQEIAEFVDLTISIAAAKAAAQTQSVFTRNGRAPEGHFGATQVVLAAPGDENDPAKLYAAIGQLFSEMEETKKVKPQRDGIVLIVRPSVFYTLQQAEQIVNGEYLTSDGNKLTGIPSFKGWGVPVLSSENLPNTVIEGHLLSNDDNDDFYDGDFSSLVAVAVSPKALLIAEALPLQSSVWWSDASKCYFVDSWMSFAVGLDRVENAGRIDKAA
ncbi:major capsid protein [Bacteriophage Titan-X]|uniref:Major capsid protein n=1 Tax=Bacteriophage Titan-X TaxID=2662140 RepID=A0A5Q2U735_9CAUD|nr:major capsid protein [Bacteriophage Titan-X]